MSDEGKIQELSSQQRLKDKGSILNYFTKKDAPIEKSKLQLNSTKDSNVDKVEDTVTTSNESKHEQRDIDVLANVDKIQPKDEKHCTTDSKEESGNVQLRREFDSTETSTAKKSELDGEANKTLDSLSKRSEEHKEESASNIDNKVKHKNIFAIMMASRDKQNEVIKKLAEEEEVKNQECDNKSERHNNSSVKVESEVCQKNGQVNLLSDKLDEAKNKKEMQSSKEVNSPLKRKKSSSSKSKPKKDKEGLNEKVSKTSSNDIITVIDDGEDFVSHDQNKNMKKAEEISSKSKVKIDFITPGSRTNSKDNEGNAVFCSGQSEKSNSKNSGNVVNEVIKDDKRKGSFKQFENLRENSFDKDSEDVEVLQTSPHNPSSVTKVPTTPSAVIGNAFTLLMTNRHKMNKQSVTKKDESTDDDTCSEDLNHDKVKKKKIKKYIEQQTGKRGQKRKKSSSCDLDSSINDFEDIVDKKKQSKFRKVTVDSESSSTEEDNENDGGENKSDSSSMISTSCDEIEIFGDSKKLTVKDQTKVTPVSADQDVGILDKQAIISNHGDTNKIGIVKASNYLTSEENEVANKECCDSSPQGKVKKEIQEHRSSDELVKSVDSDFSQNQTEISIMETDGHSKDDVADINNAQGEVKKEDVSSANISAIDSKKMDMLEKENVAESIEGSSSDESDITSQLRRMRKLRKTKDTKCALTKKRIMVEENEVENVVKNKELGHKNKEQVAEEVSSCVPDGPPKKKRKRGNHKKLEGDNENLKVCSDKDLVQANITDEIKEDNISVTKKDNIPVAKEGNMPVTKEDNIPVAKEDSIPVAKEDNLPVTKEDSIPVTKEDNLPLTKKGNISTFFKKISKEEKEVERNKNVITIKVDVHAPCEGRSPNKGSRTNKHVNTGGNFSRGKDRPQVRRSSRRLKKELEDFDKIELLEQIQINSPKKVLNAETIKKDSKSIKRLSLVLNSAGKASQNDSLDKENECSKSNESRKISSKLEGLPKTLTEVSHAKGSEVDDMGKDENVGQVSANGIPKLDGKKKKLVKKKVLGKREQPKLTVNKIKEAQSARKVSSSKLLKKRKVNLKKQGTVNMAKRKRGERESTASSTDDENEQPAKFKDSIHTDNSEKASSSSEEIFVKKKGKKSFPPCALPEAAEMVNDDKENMGQGRCHASKKSRATESSAMLKEGSLFSSFDEWNSRLEKLRADGHSCIRVRDSKFIKVMGKKSGKIIKPSLKYSYVIYRCHINYSRKDRKLVEESQENIESECPWKLKIMPSHDGKSLVIKEICLEHNHPLEKEEDNIATSSGEDDSETSETQAPSTPANRLNQLKTPSGSKKKKQPTVSKVVTGRKTLKSQDNLENQIQGKIKGSKINGKSKRSPKGRKKRIGTEILGLQDDAIKKMAKNDSVKVCMAVEEIIVVDEDSPTNKTDKVVSKKTKIPPLILKPPPKEQKPMKIKKGTSMLKKKNHEIKGSKLKNGKNLQVNEESKMVSSRPSRQAAIKVKKLFEGMSSEEDSDVSDIETISLKGTTEKESVLGSKSQSSSSKHCKKDSKMVKKKLNDSVKKAEKLAPIFCKRPKSPEIEILKTTLSPAKLKARQDFLQSGIPEQMKKQQLLEKSQEELLLSFAPFPKFNHVQQRDVDDLIWNLEYPKTLLLKDDADNFIPDYNCTGIPIQHKDSISPVTLVESDSSVVRDCSLDMTAIAVILKSMKRNNPKFPVFTFFKMYFDLKKEAVESYKREMAKECSVIDVEGEETKLSDKQRRRSKERLSRRGRKKKPNRRSEEIREIEETIPSIPLWHERIPSVWTQVYAPKKGIHVIGNKGHVKKLKGWLQDWKNKSEAFAVKERNKKLKSSKKDDDFIASDESSDEEDDFVSTYLLCGPPGVGKTAIVYALAAELGYKVLEVNASSKRPGKHVMSQLAEATQSHSVSNSSNQPTNSITALFAAKGTTQSKKVKSKASRDTEVESQGSNRDSEKKKGLSVVLFEDIDIVFEESDEGFLSTVNNFMTTTKRPIILTVSHPTHIAISKIKGGYERLDFESPPEDLIAQHLQLICLVNGQHICLDDIEKLVCVNKCDIRQSLLDVQVWSNSGSSSEKCTCLARINLGETEETNLEPISLLEIFSEKIDTESKTVETYRKNLWGKVHSRYIANVKELISENVTPVYSRILSKDSPSISWSQTVASLPFFLPYPIREETKIKKYPLKADDPSVKTTYLWQKYNWLSIDEDEDESVPPPVEEKVVVEKDDLKAEVPQYVLDSSKKGVSSIAKFYDTVAELDLLDSCYLMTQPNVDSRNGDWWKKDPTPGLSDLESHYKHWEPYSLIPCISDEIGQRAFKHCFNETNQLLEDMPSRDWKQVTLPIQEKDKPVLLESQLNADEWSLREMKKIGERVISNVPLVQQLSRKGYVDYLYFVRSVIRHDELSSVVSASRRGRRIISQTSQYGIDISRGDKIRLANSCL